MPMMLVQDDDPAQLVGSRPGQLYGSSSLGGEHQSHASQPWLLPTAVNPSAMQVLPKRQGRPRASRAYVAKSSRHSASSTQPAGSASSRHWCSSSRRTPSRTLRPGPHGDRPCGPSATRGLSASWWRSSVHPLVSKPAQRRKTGTRCGRTAPQPPAVRVACQKRSISPTRSRTIAYSLSRPTKSTPMPESRPSRPRIFIS